jgi:hypothetical protein
MKRLLLILGILVIGCSNFNPIEPEDCDCGLEISSDLPQSNGVYELEFNENLAQTYSILSCSTECGWSQHIQWDSNYQYEIVPGQWTSLVNPASMTDEDGNGNIVFAVWEAFIDSTIIIHAGYTDDCGHHFTDSINIKVVDDE